MPFDSTTYAPVETPAIVSPIGPVEQTLIEARELISTPEKWARSSRELDGKRHCIVTAIHRGGDQLLAMWERGPIYRLLEKAAGCSWVVAWNDAPTTTHADVMDAFDRAIELAARERV